MEAYSFSTDGECSFICPRDREPLRPSTAFLSCPQCGTAYPVVRGVPILLNEGESLFDTDEVRATAAEVQEGSGYWRQQGRYRLYRRIVGKIQNHTVHISTCTARAAIAQVRQENPDARILVIGAANNDFGADDIVYSDVCLGAKVSVVFDAHAIPYPDGYFDLVIAVAILEHVLDPWQCAQEMTRVIAPEGYVYSSIPFLQPVHMGAYDFTRFTYLGHRHLFRWFSEIDGGSEMGPATSTAFALQSVLLSFSDRPLVRKVMRLAGILGAAVLKPVDRLIWRRQATIDGAASTFFFGQKMDHPIADRELLKHYRGAQ